ncbi:unnamed protein product, partial [Amoebophrya sp. A25]
AALGVSTPTAQRAHRERSRKRQPTSGDPETISTTTPKTSECEGANLRGRAQLRCGGRVCAQRSWTVKKIDFPTTSLGRGQGSTTSKNQKSTTRSATVLDKLALVNQSKQGQHTTGRGRAQHSSKGLDKVDGAHSQQNKDARHDQHGNSNVFSKSAMSYVTKAARDDKNLWQWESRLSLVLALFLRYALLAAYLERKGNDHDASGYVPVGELHGFFKKHGAWAMDIEQFTELLNRLVRYSKNKEGKARFQIVEISEDLHDRDLRFDRRRPPVAAAARFGSGEPICFIRAAGKHGAKARDEAGRRTGFVDLADKDGEDAWVDLERGPSLQFWREAEAGMDALTMSPEDQEWFLEDAAQRQRQKKAEKKNRKQEQEQQRETSRNELVVNESCGVFQSKKLALSQHVESGPSASESRRRSSIDYISSTSKFMGLSSSVMPTPGTSLVSNQSDSSAVSSRNAGGGGILEKRRSSKLGASPSPSRRPSSSLHLGPSAALVTRVSTLMLRPVVEEEAAAMEDADHSLAGDSRRLDSSSKKNGVPVLPLRSKQVAASKVSGVVGAIKTKTKRISVTKSSVKDDGKQAKKTAMSAGDQVADKKKALLSLISAGTGTSSTSVKKGVSTIVSTPKTKSTISRRDAISSSTSKMAANSPKTVSTAQTKSASSSKIVKLSQASNKVKSSSKA